MPLTVQDPRGPALAPLRPWAPFLLVPLGTLYCQLYEIFVADQTESLWASLSWATATLTPWSIAAILFENATRPEDSRVRLLCRALVLALAAYLVSGAAALLLSGDLERAFFTRLPGAMVALLAASLYPLPGKSRPPEEEEGDGAIPIAPTDIVFASAAGNYIELHAAGRSKVWRQTMRKAEQILRPAGFIRVHRSYLVPRRSISEVRRGRKGPVEVSLRDGRRLPVSSCYAANLRD